MEDELVGSVQNPNSLVMFIRAEKGRGNPGRENIRITIHGFWATKGKRKKQRLAAARGNIAPVLTGTLSTRGHAADGGKVILVEGNSAKSATHLRRQKQWRDVAQSAERGRERRLHYSIRGKASQGGAKKPLLAPSKMSCEEGES